MAHNLPPQGANYDGYSTLVLYGKNVLGGVYSIYAPA